MSTRHLGWKLAFAALGLLAAAEIAARVAARRADTSWALDFGARLGMDNSIYQPHPYVGWVLKPGVARVHEGSRMRTNALGFRGPEIAPVKPEGVLRVACLGGSTTWGVGASDDLGTWPEQLAARLTEALAPGLPWTRAEAINGGCSGYTLMESFVDLKMRVAALQPDLVVVYHGINDARVVGLAGFKPDYTHVRGPWIIPMPGRLDVLLGWSELYGWMNRESTVGPNLYEIVYVKELGSQRFDPEQQAGVETYARTLRELAAVARTDGAEPVFATFGYSRDVRPLRREDWMREYGFGLVERLNLATREVGARAGVSVADVGGALAGRAELFVDAVHVNDEGNAVIAAALLRCIIGERVLEKLAARAAGAPAAVAAPPGR